MSKKVNSDVQQLILIPGRTSMTPQEFAKIYVGNYPSQVMIPKQIPKPNIKPKHASAPPSLPKQNQKIKPKHASTLPSQPKNEFHDMVALPGGNAYIHADILEKIIGRRYLLL